MFPQSKSAGKKKIPTAHLICRRLKSSYCYSQVFNWQELLFTLLLKIGYCHINDQNPYCRVMSVCFFHKDLAIINNIRAKKQCLFFCRTNSKN